MSEITPENVQDQVNVFRQMQQQIQNLSQQASQMDMTIGETERTLEEVENAAKDTILYRAIGSVMKKIDDNALLINDLKDEKERMEIRNNSLKNQIEKMNVELAEMQAKLEPVLQDIQGKNDNPSK